MNRVPRRGLLGAGLAILAAAPATPVQLHPDAELLAACAAFDELERAYISISSTVDEAADAELDRIADAQDPLVERMCQLRATTREGESARVRSLLLWAPDLVDEESPSVDKMLLRSILRDLTNDAYHATA